MQFTNLTENLLFNNHHKFNVINQSSFYTLLNDLTLVFYLLLITNGFIAPIAFNNDYVLLNNSLIFKILKFAPFIMVLIFNPRANLSIINTSKTDKLIILIALFYLCSTFWSAASFETLTSSVQFLIFIYFCFYLNRLENINVYRALKLYLVFVVVFSYVFYLFIPSFGRMTGFSEGLARGIFFHKNSLGAILTALAPVAIVFYKGITRIVLLLLILGLVFLSGSATSIIGVSFLILISLSVKWFKKKKAVFLVGLLLSGIGYLYLNYFNNILALVGKSEHLTGRVILWENILVAIKEKLYLGWGYWGFWNIAAKSNLFAEMSWMTGKSHNAFLDMALSGGLILLVIGLVWLILVFSKIINIEDVKTRSYGLLTFFAIISLSFTEIGLFEHNSLFLFLLYFTTKLPDNISLNQSVAPKIK